MINILIVSWFLKQLLFLSRSMPINVTVKRTKTGLVEGIRTGANWNLLCQKDMIMCLNWKQNLPGHGHRYMAFWALPI
ncbi:hypothetical protein CGCF415_v012384 [Colletotrichum fructicola]|nr:hypothetical protein CGCFRS4_v010863 [Colletotrichum fructicola]KAF4894097.1 hypothetical protein CGCF415_v012384 [Colletotrichum fructicola]KAF4929061.1 hypothetical protein CGCF245_v012340 [Colletotrichum fructicola]